MSRTKKQLDTGLHFREFLPGPVKLETREFECVAATENAVLMPDWERMEMVPEVLLMAGAKVPPEGHVPLLNAHSRESVDDVLGSARLRVDGDKLTGVAQFSSTAERELTKVNEGHVKALSIGYQVHRKQHVPAGKTEQINGRSFTGPVNVATSWSLKELSVCPIGADEQAKMRGFTSDPFANTHKEVASVLKSTRKLLVRAGMPDKHDDKQAVEWLVGRGMPAGLEAVQIDDWVADNEEKLSEKRSEQKQELKPDPLQPARGSDGVALIGVQDKDIQETARKIFEESQRLEREHREAMRKFHAFVKDTCKRHGMSDRAQEVIDTCGNEAEAGRKILDMLAERSEKSATPFTTGGGVEFVAAQHDKHIGAVRSALLHRAVGLVVRNDPEQIAKLVPKDSYVAGWETFRNATLLDLATQCLVAGGIDTRSLSREQIAKAALGFTRQAGISVRYGAGYHTTGDFTNITLDAINKTLLAGYSEAPQTWRTVFRQAASAPDFKNIHRVKFGEAPDLDLWPDNTKPQEIAFSDEKESYAVNAYSYIASFSWRLIVNDDLDALSRVPAMMGAASARTVNRVAWAQITSNPTMSDGQTLFLSSTAGNRKKVNMVTGSGSPSVSTVQTLKNLLRQQVGLNTPENAASDAILGLTPRYIVGPSALETTILQLVNSIADPAASGNAGVFNPARSLVPVIEPVLDGSSTLAWYLFCDPSQIDTVEVTFLQGQESPVTDSWEDQETSAMKYRITQTFAAKAIDFRGMAKHKGEA